MTMISENIRFYRKTNNMSQDELAEKLGVSRQSISFWENGQTQPTLENVIALAKIFNISSDALLSPDPAPAGANTEKAPNKNIPDGHHGKKKVLWLLFMSVLLYLFCLFFFITAAPLRVIPPQPFPPQQRFHLQQPHRKMYPASICSPTARILQFKKAD